MGSPVKKKHLVLLSTVCTNSLVYLHFVVKKCIMFIGCALQKIVRCTVHFIQKLAQHLEHVTMILAYTGTRPSPGLFFIPLILQIILAIIPCDILY